MALKGGDWGHRQATQASGTKDEARGDDGSSGTSSSCGEMTGATLQVYHEEGVATTIVDLAAWAAPTELLGIRVYTNGFLRYKTKQLQLL
jgi:hypothetical protein